MRRIHGKSQLGLKIVGRIPNTTLSTQHEPQSFLFEKLDLFTSKTRSDSGPVFCHVSSGLRWIIPNLSRPLWPWGWATPQPLESPFGSKFAEDGAEFVYFLGIQSSTFENSKNFEVIAIFKKRPSKVCLKYFLGWPCCHSMLLSFQKLAPNKFDRSYT